MRGLFGLHALNNALQRREFEENELREIAEQLTIKTLERDQLYYQFCDDYGYFEVDVLSLALMRRNMELRRVQDVAWLTKNDGNYIINKNNHWLAIRKYGREIINCDSTLAKPEVIQNITRLRELLAGHRSIMQIITRETTIDSSSQHNRSETRPNSTTNKRNNSSPAREPNRSKRLAHLQTPSDRSLRQSTLNQRSYTPIRDTRPKKKNNHPLDRFIMNIRKWKLMLCPYCHECWRSNRKISKELCPRCAKLKGTKILSLYIYNYTFTIKVILREPRIIQELFQIVYQNLLLLKNN